MFLKSYDRNDLLRNKFSDKCKMDFPRSFRSWKILEGQPQKFIE